MAAMEIAIDGAYLGAQDPLQRQGPPLDQHHFSADLSGRGGDLRADPAGPTTTTRLAGVIACLRRSESSMVRR